MDTTTVIAQTAARYIIEEGLNYQAAKQRALKVLSLPTQAVLPNNQAIEVAVRMHIQLFCAETQSQELAALRNLALQWMQQLAAYQPLIGGAVWNGTATRLNDIYLQLFTDDSKQLEIDLINQNTSYQTNRTHKALHHTACDMLSINAWCATLNEYIGVHLIINPLRAPRGSLQNDAQGRTLRGNLAMLQALLHAS